ncbi:unnamed protein product, partial [Rotaria sordida]
MKQKFNTVCENWIREGDFQWAKLRSYAPRPLLKSEIFQYLNDEWATTLYCLLELKQIQKKNKYLQLCHQIQFTISSKNDLSIFSEFHKPYEELREILDTCIKDNTNENQWQLLLDWIELKLNSNLIELQLKEIKVMLLLN